jgi:flavodoxin
MNALIIYTSIHHGSTEKIAQAIADVLNARIVKPSEIKSEEINNYDLIGFGSGVYFGRYHRTLIDFVKKLPKFQNKKTFIFSTSGRSESVFFNLFTRNFRKLLKSKGFEIVSTFNCPGYDTFGWLKIFGGLNKNRPNKKDLEEAEKFARNLFNNY